MTWNIVSDSSCDLRTASFHSSCVRFETVPLRIQVGGREFVDDDALSVPALLSAMAVEKAASSSACPSPADFAGAFERGDRTVCFTLSSQLSGTYHAACIAREMVLEEHPEKQICVIDSRAAAGTMVLLIRRAQALMEAAGDDGDFDALCQQLHRYQATLRTCFTLENFDNLIKNGRMRPIVGTLLRSLGIHLNAALHNLLEGRPQQAQTDENRLEQLRLTFGLTPRETQILQLLLTFSSNEEITDSLGISAHTLQKHNIFRKTGVSSRWELLKKGQTL